MRLFPPVCLVALGLAACGQGTESEPAATPPAPQRPEMTDEQRQAVLISLPAPYNEGDLENGRRVFARCRSCHTLPEGGANMTGPNLWGVFGRDAGSHPDFRYSEALQAADFQWEAEQLDQWLASPREFLPGNRMAFAGIPDETDRRDLIAYLKVETGYAPE
ncbi:cytochrome c family protein [Brevundimonas sp.]|uniref:c-type cytochrome n=1 Tax=Brevundimonas sp. TaxID=1871086 RepID=UPI0025E7D3CB|nr:cytochrome c family protein [Brevundimonas sp.]